MVEAYSDGKKTGAGPENSERSGWDTCPLASYIANFYFLRTSTKIIQNFKRKRGCCSVLGPPLN